MADRSHKLRKHTPSGPVRAVVRHRRTVPVPEGFRHPLASTTPPAPPVLLPLIGIDDDLGAALERSLQPVAVRARAGDRAARDALYAAFQPKMTRFVRRIRAPFAPDGCTGLWERADVEQEAYLAFAGVVESWSPEIPFGRYMLAHFPWRLRDAVYRGVGRRGVPARMSAVPIVNDEAFRDHASGDDEQWALIEALAASFEPPLDDLLRLRILDRQTLAEAAINLGVSRRSASRYWRTILIRLRADERPQR